MLKLLAVTASSRKHTLLVVDLPGIPQVPVFPVPIDRSPRSRQYLPVVPRFPLWSLQYAPVTAQCALPFCLANLELTLRGRCPKRSASSQIPPATYIRSSTDNADIR